MALSAVTVISARCCSRQSKLCLPVQVPSSPLRRRNATPCAIIAARVSSQPTSIAEQTLHCMMYKGQEGEGS